MYGKLILVLEKNVPPLSSAQLIGFRQALNWWDQGMGQIYSDTSASEWPCQRIFRLMKIFLAVFQTRLTNVLVDARANIKQQTWTVGPFQELIFSFYFPFSFIQLGSCSPQPLVSFCPLIVWFLLFYKTYL